MPYVNGNFHRSAGQGYAVEKAKMGAKKTEGGDDSPHNEDGKEKGAASGSIVHVKHAGGGKIHIKHEDGSVTKHESMDEANEHMKEHFGLHDEPAMESGDEAGEYEDYGSEGGDALKSILGS